MWARVLFYISSNETQYFDTRISVKQFPIEGHPETEQKQMKLTVYAHVLMWFKFCIHPALQQFRM